MSKYNLKNLVARVKKYKVEYILFIIAGLIVNTFINYSGLTYEVSKEHTYSPFRRYLYKKVNSCFMRSDNPIFQELSHFVKGEKYIVQLSHEENIKFRKECIITTWNMLHFSAHLVMVFLFPLFYREIFTVSFLFEIYEYYVFQCHDLSDILYNIAGLYLGYQLRQLYDRS